MVLFGVNGKLGTMIREQDLASKRVSVLLAEQSGFFLIFLLMEGRTQVFQRCIMGWTLRSFNYDVFVSFLMGGLVDYLFLLLVCLIGRNDVNINHCIGVRLKIRLHETVDLSLDV